MTLRNRMPSVSVKPSEKSEICAVMSRDAAERAAAAPNAARWGLQAVSQGSVAAVVAAAPPPLPKQGPIRRIAGQALVERQALLEYLLEYGDVLPSQPGTALPPEWLGPFMAMNSTVFQASLAQFADLIQFQIVVSWDRKAARRRFGQPGQTLSLREVDAVARHYADGFQDQLAAMGVDFQPLPRTGQEMLLNVAVLVPRCGVAALDTALGAIDSVWSEGLSIRRIGPLPAVSFATLSIECPPVNEIRAAMRRLGITNTADDIDTAFRRCIGLDGCAARPGARAVSALKEARDLLRRVQSVQQSASAAGFAHGLAPLFAKLRRDGTAESRNARPAVETAA